MQIWSDNERTIIRDALKEGSIFRDALKKYCTARAARLRKNSQTAMLSAPRQYEVAADYMAKAEEIDSFIAHINQAISNDFDGPTVE